MEQEVWGKNELYLTYFDSWVGITGMSQLFEENFMIFAWWPILPHITRN